MSGERGTKSQQQDRRNQADRDRAAAGGSGNSGARGTLSQQQDRRNMANAQRAGNIAPGVDRDFVSGMKNATMRRTLNPSPSYPMSLHNMIELSKMLPGPGMGLRALGGALGLGIGPEFEGPMGMANTPGDMDPTNRAGTNPMNTVPMPGVQGITPAGQGGAGAPTMPGMTPLAMQPAMLGGPVPGLQDYSVQLPGYNYFGQPPALTRPPGTGMAPMGQPQMGAMGQAQMGQPAMFNPSRPVRRSTGFR